MIAWTAFVAERPVMLRALTRTIRAAFERLDSEHPVFHGCWDWHSSVHGHWALLRASEILRDKELVRAVAVSLASGDLTAERRDLRERSEFEVPYGRAWFLLLAREHIHATGEPLLLPFAGDIADSLWTFLRGRPFDPSIDEYQNHSWALRQLLRYEQWRGNRSRVSEIGDYVRTGAEVSLPLDLDVEKPGFFSVWANLAHVLELVFSSEEYAGWLERHPVDAAAAPIETAVNSHQLAINYSRAWGFQSAYRMTRREAYLQAALRHIRAGYALHETCKDDYKAYGHWVSQFGVYAMTE